MRLRRSAERSHPIDVVEMAERINMVGIASVVNHEHTAEALLLDGSCIIFQPEAEHHYELEPPEPPGEDTICIPQASA